MSDWTTFERGEETQRRLRAARERVAAVDIPAPGERRNWTHHSSDSFSRAIQDRQFLLELHDEIQAIGERAALAEPSRDAGLDVRRVKQAVTNIAVRHGVVKDQPPLNWTLMSMYGYSATIADMDAEIAAEYDRLAPAPAPPAADLARWLQDTFESQPAITIRQGVEPQVAWRALADELLRRWGR